LLVKHWLMGDELSDLQRKYNHSLSAIENYISTFKRVVVLQHQKYSVEDSAYLLKISQALVTAYRQLYLDNEKRTVSHRKRELQELLDIQQVKKTAQRRAHS
jgi:predicted transcriptional regulator